MLRLLDASICDGTARAEPILVKQSEMKRIKMIRRRSAGPLISKFRNKELARKRSSVSSRISASFGSARRACQMLSIPPCCYIPIGAGPRILVFIGSTDILPTCLTSGSSLNAE